MNKILQLLLLVLIVVLQAGCTVFKPEVHAPWAVNDKCQFITKVTHINKAYTTFTIEDNPYKKACNKYAKFKNQVTFIPSDKIIIREDILKELSLFPKIDQRYKISFGIFYASKVTPRINEFRIKELIE